MGTLALVVLAICLATNTVLEASGITYVRIGHYSNSDQFLVSYDDAPTCTAEEAVAMNLNSVLDCRGIDYKLYDPDGDQSDWHFHTSTYSSNLYHEDADYGTYIFQIRDRSLPQYERMKPENELYYFYTYSEDRSNQGMLDNQTIIDNHAPEFAMQDTQYAVLAGQEISIPLMVSDTDNDEIKLKILRGTGSIENDNFVWTPSLGDKGTVNDIRIRAYDGRLGYDYVDMQITVIDIPLGIGPIGNQTAQEPPTAQNVTLRVTAGESVYDYLGNSISDPEDGNLTATIIEPGDKGTAEITAFNTFAYAANKNAEGTDAVRYLVTDDHNLTATATITLEIEPFDDNVPPAAFDFEITVGEAGSVLINPLRSGLVRDDNGDPLSITISRQPLVGLVQASGTTMNYSVPSNSAGQTVDFDYVVDDGRGGNATATVTVNIGRPMQMDVIAMTVDDYVWARPGTTVEINPLDNDINQIPWANFKKISPFGPSRQSVRYSPDNPTFLYTSNATATGLEKIGYQIRLYGSTGYGFGSDVFTAHIHVMLQPSTQSDQIAPDIPIATPLDTSVTIRPPINSSSTITDAFGSTKGNIITALLSTGRILYTPAASQSGVDSINYTVRDGQGATATGVITIYINEQDNTSPQLVSMPNMSASTNQTLTFRAAASDADDNALIFGIANEPSGATMTPEGYFKWVPDVSHIGEHEITITVHDGHGGADWQDIVITVLPEGVTNRNPSAPYSVVYGSKYMPFIIRPDISDPDGDVTRIVSARTDRGSSSHIQLVDNTIVITGNLNFRYIIYIVSDDQGGMDRGVINTRFINWPYLYHDTIWTNYSRSVSLGDTSAFTTIAFAPHSDTFTFDLLHEPLGATITPQGEFRWTPTASQTGRHEFWVIVSDNQGNWSWGSTEINVLATNPNMPPVAENFTVTVREDDTTFVNLIQNGLIGDENNDPLSVTILRQPILGTAVADDGVIYYISPSNSDGQTTSFDYAVDDGRGGNATATITVNVGQPPQTNIVTVDDNVTTAYRTPIRINVLDNDIINPPTTNFDVVILQQPMQGRATVEPDGRTILYRPDHTAINQDQFVYELRASGTNISANVTVTIPLSVTLNHPHMPRVIRESNNEGFPIYLSNPNNLNITWTIIPDNLGATIKPSNSKPRFVWTTDEAHGGAVYEFNIVATTSIGSTSANQSVIVRETNQNPTFTTDQTEFITATRVPFKLDLNATDADIPEQVISYHILSQNPSDTPATINTRTGVLTWTPSVAETRTILVRASDDFDPPGTADIILNITALPKSLIPNTAPTAASFGVRVNQSGTIIIDLADQSRISDNEQNADTLEVRINDIPAQTQGNASVAGTVITYEARDDATGNDTISYTVIDNEGLNTTETISITILEAPVTNTPPTATHFEVRVNQSGTIIIDLADQSRISDNQQDADTLRVSISNPPSQGTANVTGTTITYAANDNATGNDTISYIVIDDGDLVAAGTITVMIIPTIPAVSGDFPVAPSFPETTDEDKSVTITPVIYDPDGGASAITAVSRPSKGNATHTATNITYTPHRDENGPDSFTYTVTDDEGQTDTGTINITISPVNDAPVLDPLDDRHVDIETMLVFIVTATDADDDPLSFAAMDEPPGATLDDAGYFSWMPSAAQNGSHTFAVAVSDGHGGSDYQNITITVTGANTPPTAQSFVTVVGKNDDVFIDLTRVWVIHDADNDLLNLTVSRQPEIGSAQTNGTTVYYFSPPNSTGRTTSFDYTVSDGRGGTATATVTVNIIDPAQTIMRPADDAAQTAPGVPIIINVLDNDIVGPPETNFVLAVLHQPQKGSATVSPSGSTILYTPNAGATGQDTFVYAIRSNGTDRLASVTVTIKSTNAPPVALDAIVNTDEFGDALVDLIAEGYATDEDPDTMTAEILAQGTQGYANAFGSSVYYQSYIGATGIDAVHYGVTDSGGLKDSGRIYIVLPEAGVNQPPTADDFVIDTISGGTVWTDMFEEGHINDDDPGTMFAYVSIPPTKGSAHIRGTTMIYSVDEGQTGLDVFGYTVTDAHGEEASALVAVWITDNTPPIAANIDLEVAAGQAIDVNLLQDGHITDDSPETLTARILAPPSLGSATISSDVILRYESNADLTGLDVFSYVVTDAHGSTDTGLVTVSVLPEPNIPPVGQDIDITVAPGQTVSRNMADLVHDPEGGTVIIGISRQPSQGSASVSGTTITYVADDDAAGTDSFGYLLIDDYGAFTSWTVSVTIAEPRAAGAPDQPPTASDFVVHADRTGAARIDLAGAGHVTDDDISTATVEILEQARKGRALVIGSIIIYQADLDVSGTDTVRYQVTDLAGATAEGTMIVILQSSVTPPSASGFDIEAVLGQTVEVDLLEEDYISDDSPDTLTVSITIQPALGMADIVNDTVLRYQADANRKGLAALEYMVTDADGENATAVVSVSVIAPQVTVAPTAKSISIPTSKGQDTQVDLLRDGYVDDDDLDELVASIVLQPKLGRATVVDNTIIRYQADDTREGLDVFAYAVTDPDGENATGVVTVSALPGSNMPPTGQDITITVAPGSTADRDIAGIISDQEDNNITVSISRQPLQGNASAAGTTVSYTARPDAAGTDSFGYLLVDEFGASSQWNVTVEISDMAGTDPNPVMADVPVQNTTVNQNPVNDVPVQNTTNPSPVMADVPPPPSRIAPVVADPDDHSIIMAPVTDTTTGSMLEAYMSRGLVVFAGSPAPGLDATRGNTSAGFLLAGIIINGTYAGLPGTGIADYDGIGPGDITVFISEIGNVPPTMSPVGDHTINALDTLTFAVSATDFNDTVSYRLSGAPGNAAISGEGIFRWTPGSADEGSHAFMITAYDGHGATDTESVTVTVLPTGTPNESPTAPNVAATVAPDGRVVIIPAISDPDGDPVRITRATGNVEGTIMQSDNGIEYTTGPNPGTETIIYNVVDGRGGIATGTITITIQ